MPGANFPIYNAHPEALSAHENTIKNSQEVERYRTELRVVVNKMYPRPVTEIDITHGYALCTAVMSRTAITLIEANQKPSSIISNPDVANLLEATYDLELLRRDSAKKLKIGEPIAGAVIANEWNSLLEAIITERKERHQIIPL